MDFLPIFTRVLPISPDFCQFHPIFGRCWAGFQPIFSLFSAVFSSQGNATKPGELHLIPQLLTAFPDHLCRGDKREGDEGCQEGGKGEGKERERRGKEEAKEESCWVGTASRPFLANNCNPLKVGLKWIFVNVPSCRAPECTTSPSRLFPRCVAGVSQLTPPPPNRALSHPIPGPRVALILALGRGGRKHCHLRGAHRRSNPVALQGVE